jgi:hypothetical protein
MSSKSDWNRSSVVRLIKGPDVRQAYEEEEEEEEEEGGVTDEENADEGAGKLKERCICGV